MITNVPGPGGPVYLAGRRVRGTIGVAAESGSLGLGVSIISYDGEIVIGLMTDVHLIPEAEPLLELVCGEVAALLDLLAAPAPTDDQAAGRPTSGARKRTARKRTPSAS